MIVQRLRAVDQVITAFFIHICRTANVCGALLESMSTIPVRSAQMRPGTGFS
jgi:hypothetical protein